MSNKQPSQKAASHAGIPSFTLQASWDDDIDLLTNDLIPPLTLSTNPVPSRPPPVSHTHIAPVPLLPGRRVPAPGSTGWHPGGSSRGRPRRAKVRSAEEERREMERRREMKRARDRASARRVSERKRKDAEEKEARLKELKRKEEKLREKEKKLQSENKKLRDAARKGY